MEQPPDSPNLAYFDFFSIFNIRNYTEMTKICRNLSKHDYIIKIHSRKKVCLVSLL